MTAATQLITSFLGGEISQYAQGRYDRQDYRTSLRVCLNSFPLEIGGWTRRPGTMYAGHTRGGGAGRVIKFDFNQSTPVTKEYTDGYVRFRSGAALIGTNDDRSVIGLSAANPVVVSVTPAVTWVTGNTVVFLGAATPLLEGRQFKITSVDLSNFSLQDALTGANIDGSTLGALAVGATVRRVQELQTVYVGQAWTNLRAVQAETTDALLCPGYPPQIMSVSTLPAMGVSAQFAITEAVFKDGPYLDPFANGALANPSALTGSITLTVSFAAYSATAAYAKGTFITSASVNYVSLIDNNVGNTPAGSPSAWQATSASAAINNGLGFLGTDVGRLVRLYSEPAAWSVATAYSVGQTVSYNPSGQPGASTYWQAIAGSTGKAPGSDLTNWQLLSSAAAIWTWGKITALTNVIDRALAGSVNIGNLNGGGGVNAAFNGNFSQVGSACAEKPSSGASVPLGTVLSDSGYVGKNYSGASAQKISQAVVYPSSDNGFGGVQIISGGISSNIPATFSLNLRAKNTAPASPSDGTLLGSIPVVSSGGAKTITSNDVTTTWNYVWIETIISAPTGGTPVSGYTILTFVGQVSFFSPTTSGSSSAGCQVEILGPALLYSQPITTWRLGAYSNTTGWPTCGCYDGGRIFLGGAIANRWDACVSNGISGNTINFAPTDAYGTVADSNAISYTFNADSSNPIFWMNPTDRGISMGTQAGEWLVFPPTTGPLTARNVDSRRVTKIGSANVEPRNTEHTLIFVKRFGRKLMEYFSEVFSGKLSSKNLADKAQHLTNAGISELAYTDAVNPILWTRDAAGDLRGVTYKRESLASGQEPTFYGWHRHELGSGRNVESVCSGPSVNGDLDTLTMVTNDAATIIRHVELLTDAPDETATLSDAWFLDDAVNPTSVSSSAAGLTINGLWHLNGKAVQVFAGGLDLGHLGDARAWSATTTYGAGAYVKGSDRLFYVSLSGGNVNHDPTTDGGVHWRSDYVVSNGSVTVPYADGISAGPGNGLFTFAFASALALSEIVVGFTYNSDGQLVRLVGQADTGARNGPAMGASSRTHRCAIKLVNAKGLYFGGTFDDLMPCMLKASGSSPTDLAVLSTFSGVFYDQVKDDFSYEDSLCWRVSRPYPCTITAAAQNLRTEDM